MSDYHEHQLDELLERYLDGLMTGDELREFELHVESDESLRAAVEQHRTFEELLKRKVVPPNRSVEGIESLLKPIDGVVGASRETDVQPSEQPVTPAPQEQPDRRRLLIGIASAVAAVVVCVFVFNQPQGPKQVTAFFEQRPLAELYGEVVEQGFRPYYFCEDQERFARTFRKRQDIPVILKDTPDDRRMVGLSYIGGLSRDTTAMLAYVEEQPVVVFVDRSEFDNRPLLSRQKMLDPELHVHRSELGELVMYEVSPFETVKMTPYLEAGN